MNSIAIANAPASATKPTLSLPALTLDEGN
jgi:hypothetical protein